MYIMGKRLVCPALEPRTRIRDCLLYGQIRIKPERQKDQRCQIKGPKDAEAGITSAFAGVEEQQADLDSILNYYKRALRLRNENPELARGTIEAVETLCDGHQAVITKTWEDSTIAVVYNTSDEAIEVNLAGSAIDSMAIRGYLTLHGEAITLENGVLTMPAQSICIMK